MHNPKLTWKKSPSGDVVSYRIYWKQNGTLVNTANHPKVGNFDTFGYTVEWNADNPETPVLDGDVIVADLRAVDSGGLESAPLAQTLNVPSEPPEQPVDVVLSLS